jgi:hypothetical protein
MARFPGFGQFINTSVENQKLIDDFDRMVYRRLARSVDAEDIQNFVAEVLWNEDSFCVPEGFNVERRFQNILSSFIKAGGL